MRKCIRCGNSHDNKKVCNSCLSNWADMRTIIWETMEIVYGSFIPETQKEWVKQTKKLESIWRKDKSEFDRKIAQIKEEKEALKDGPI